MQRLDFNEWMLKINNIYYAQNERMANAAATILQHEKV
jgi:hypothetical protein